MHTATCIAIHACSFSCHFEHINDGFIIANCGNPLELKNSTVQVIGNTIPALEGDDSCPFGLEINGSNIREIENGNQTQGIEVECINNGYIG